MVRYLVLALGVGCECLWWGHLGRPVCLGQLCRFVWWRVGALDGERDAWVYVFTGLEGAVWLFDWVLYQEALQEVVS